MIALCVYGGSYTYARILVRSAHKRAEAIYADPKGVNAAVLPEIDRMALLGLVETKRGHRTHEVAPSPEDLEALKKSKEKPIKVDLSYLDLVPEFLRVNSSKETETGAFVGPGSYPKNVIPELDDSD